MANFVESFRAVQNRVKDLENKAATLRKNTFQVNKDGVSYTVDGDGKPYTYTNYNGQIRNLAPMTADDQKKAISDITGGKVKIDNSINNQYYLAQIQRSINRMYNYGNGNLAPDEVQIFNSNPDDKAIFRFGVTFPRETWPGQERGARDEIDYAGTEYAKDVADKSKKSIATGWTAGAASGEDEVQTHELAHAADFAVQNMLGRQEKKALDKVKPGDSDAVSSIRDKYETIKDTFDRKNEPNPENFLQKAAEEAGFDNVVDAAKSISGYAGKIHKTQYTIGDKEFNVAGIDDYEVFAEAYTDVLLNGNGAKPFSKSLVNAYSNYVDKLSAATGRNKEKRLADIKAMFSILPPIQKNSNTTNFISNWRRNNPFLKR